MQIVKVGVLYFALAFGAGVLLGTIRVLWLVPRIGIRMAELMEAPIMFVVTVLAARWGVRFIAIPATASKRLAVGCVALALLLTAEFTVVLWLQGLTISRYLAGRDQVAGTVYVVMLGVFALMPLLVARS
jgi:hypothetical protein